MTNTNRTRRNFLKSGLGIAAAASMGAVATAGERSTTARPSDNGQTNEGIKDADNEWVAAGYLIAAPRNCKPNW